MISYTGANKDFLPAKMNFDTGKFDYGSWKDTWIMEKFKPCMLHADGTVAYYLNPYNLTQKITGGDAMPDLTSTEHDMNAMVEVGQIWIKEEVIDDDHFHIYLSPVKADGFDCWTHYNANNKLLDKIYYPMYQGSVDSNDKVRSLSHLFPTTGVILSTARTNAQNNGEGWDIEEWNFMRLMQYLCLILGKTTNAVAIFGAGVGNASGSHLGATYTGGSEEYGWFYGRNNSSFDHVRLFGFEDLWGNIWTVHLGYLIHKDGSIYVKMTPNTADGSSGTEYDSEPTSYTNVGKCVFSNANILPAIRKMSCVPGKGLIIKEPYDDNTAGKGYCGGCWPWNEEISQQTIDKRELSVASFGVGWSNDDRKHGIFSHSLNVWWNTKHIHVYVAPVFKSLK